MKVLSQKTIEGVREYAEIVGVVSQYVTLKKRGRHFVGLCPFHSEKTPSFTVSPDKRLWHCFGCHESGDLIGFIQKIENIGFQDAVSHIARTAGIPVLEEESVKTQPKSPLEKNIQELREILYQAREQFKRLLNQNNEPCQYLLNRGVTQTSLGLFHVGFCPENFNLFSTLLNMGFSQDAIGLSGLFYRKEYGEWTCRFRNRILFPILDHLGRTVGFSGRIFSTNATQQPKYINSEESSIFNKRRILYGFDIAQKKSRQTGTILLTEGYLDTIMAHQYGFENAVATMGTSLTEEHAVLMKRFAKTVYLAMDNDEAGQAATEKAYDILKRHSFELFVVPLEGKDPADILKEKGKDVFNHLLTQAVPWLEFKLKRLMTQRPIKTVEDISRTLLTLLPYIEAEKESLIQRHYIKRTAEVLGIDESLIVAKLKRKTYNLKSHFLPFKNQKRTKFVKAEEHLLFFMASDLELREKVGFYLNPSYFVTPEYRDLYEFLVKNKGKRGETLLENMEDIPLRGVLTRILIKGTELESPSPLSSSTLIWENCVDTLKAFSRQKRILEIKTVVQEKEKEDNEKELVCLLQELQELVREEKMSQVKHE